MRFIIILTLLASCAYAQPFGMTTADRLPPVSVVSTQEAENGQLGPLVYTLHNNGDADTLATPSSWVSRFIQIGPQVTGTVSAALAKGNASITRFNPDVFTFRIDLVDTINTAGSEDSIGFAAAYFEVFDDTTAAAIWAPDSINYFAHSNAYTLAATYGWRGGWIFPNRIGALATYRGKRFDYPLCVRSGTWLRFTLVPSTIVESIKFKAYLIAER